jgi:hypothetical protein
MSLNRRFTFFVDFVWVHMMHNNVFQEVVRNGVYYLYVPIHITTCNYVWQLHELNALLQVIHTVETTHYNQSTNWSLLLSFFSLDALEFTLFCWVLCEPPDVRRLFSRYGNSIPA